MNDEPSKNFNQTDGSSITKLDLASLFADIILITLILLTLLQLSLGIRPGGFILKALLVYLIAKGIVLVLAHWVRET